MHPGQRGIAARRPATIPAQDRMAPWPKPMLVWLSTPPLSSAPDPEHLPFNNCVCRFPCTCDRCFVGSNTVQRGLVQPALHTEAFAKVCLSTTRPWMLLSAQTPPLLVDHVSEPVNCWQSKQIGWTTNAHAFDGCAAQGPDTSPESDCCSYGLAAQQEAIGGNDA